jgi:hypothetical protein
MRYASAQRATAGTETRRKMTDFHAGERQRAIDASEDIQNICLSLPRRDTPSAGAQKYAVLRSRA